MAKRSPKRWYCLTGELWSGCLHMTPIDRETARRYVRLYSAKAVERRRRVAEWELTIKSSARIAAGYTYRRVYVATTWDDGAHRKVTDGNRGRALYGAA